MSLATTYRPKSIQELVGQDVLKKSLSYALDNKKPPHSLILVGIRGVGKTTTARAYAKSLLCEKGVSSTPCLQCTQCLSIEKGNHPDVIEIDAASHSSIDDAREMIAHNGIKPMMGRYRIRIIDEAHMMSKSAWNAWLKTIEEPLAHEFYVFATSEPQTIPATIRSRSQVFLLPPIQTNLIKERLLEISAHEKIQITNEAALIIAQNSEGSLRDSLTILEQANSFDSHNITKETIQNLLGLPHIEDIFEMLFAAYQKDYKKSFLYLHQTLQKNANFKNIHNSALNILINTRLISIQKDLLESLDLYGLSKEKYLQLLNYLKSQKEEKIDKSIDLFTSLATQTSNPAPLGTLEITLIRLGE